MKREYDFSRGRRGAVLPSPPGKTRVTIRLDNEILDWFREAVNAMGGGNYQTLINNALREHMSRREEPLEQTLRRIVREELRRGRKVA
ncbi:MAG: BrnA antitoxin family protein [Acidobacteriota bacterium]